MAEPFKICPICNTANHRQAVVCTTCGTSLRDVQAVTARASSSPMPMEYDYRYGETDLLESSLRNTGRAFLVGGCSLLMLLCGAVFMLVLRPQFSALVAPPAITSQFHTNTPFATVFFATVTPAPPTLSPTPSPTLSLTPTISPTPAPCTHKVVAGDDLTGIILSCGHRSMDVLSEVLKLNNLDDPSRIQIGQTIIVPWPTPTVDPNAVPTATVQGNSAAPGDSVTVAQDTGDTIQPIDPLAPPPTETLQPGVIWHKVQKGETIISIAMIYGADVQILSQLNPEVTFSQCDFGQPAGGGTCIVNLYEGQMLRVPAPTPTPTIPPTASGSETPTPTATATFNAPSAISPPNGAFFQRDELVTLRWVASGTLAPGQTYRVKVEDHTAGKTYSADTAELFMILPSEWHLLDGHNHDFTWTVSVIDTSSPNTPYFTTQDLNFTWQG